MGGGKSTPPPKAPEPTFQATPITDGGSVTRETNAAAMERTKANANPSLLATPDEQELARQRAMLG
jgi:hypothetical protein